MKKHQRIRNTAAAALAALSLAASLSHDPADGAGRSPIPPTRDSVARGSALYAKHCASCHGPHGKGDGRVACDLDPAPSDLTDRDIAGMTDVKLFRKITNGRKPMPSFRKLLGEEDRWHVVNFVRTLAAQSSGREKR